MDTKNVESRLIGDRLYALLSALEAVWASLVPEAEHEITNILTSIAVIHR